MCRDPSALGPAGAYLDQARAQFLLRRGQAVKLLEAEFEVIPKKVQKDLEIRREDLRLDQPDPFVSLLIDLPESVTMFFFQGRKYLDHVSAARPVQSAA